MLKIFRNESVMNPASNTFGIGSFLALIGIGTVAATVVNRGTNKIVDKTSDAYDSLTAKTAPTMNINLDEKTLTNALEASKKAPPKKAGE